ncbi:hypothetical protein ACFVWX_13630 [Streptomyces sp. NPDC058220]|uniref:hypothetical protein n=1 Tax=Streptomyces sp. NPDC058220 TaxID=3346387 RepID=UPI0036EBDA1F
MSARDDLRSDLLHNKAALALPYPGLWADARIDRYRNEVLNEAADAVALDRDATLPSGGRGAWRRGMTHAINLLRHMADGNAGPVEKASAPAPTATPQPERSGEWAPAAALRDRLADLLAHIRKHPGRTWTTEDVRKFYLSQAPKRATCRRDLTALRAMGWLTEHDEPGRRFFTLNTRKDGQR